MNRTLVKLAKIIPMGSVCRTAEHETVAQNILKILKRNGGKFRKLSWEEYKAELEKDEQQVGSSDKRYFEAVVDYTVSPQTCALFSSCWKV